MAKVNCAISGLTFSCDHLPIFIPKSAGYYHPIFALDSKNLLPLYSKHCQGHLTPIDSYLLLLAYLHSTGKVAWNHPCSLSPTAPETVTFIERNLRQLIEAIELTASVDHPSFKQPSYAVYSENSSLKELPSWIAAWTQNLEDFRNGYREQRRRERMVATESRLSKAILSGAAPSTYAAIIATWADKAAGFPPAKAAAYMKIIRTCYNSDKMFSTPLSAIKEVKAYCEENIEVGSIHFHTLSEALREGIARHQDYLGMGAITLLPVGFTVEAKELTAMREKATLDSPKRADYENDLDFLRAKLRYKAVEHNPTAEGLQAATPTPSSRANSTPSSTPSSITEEIRDILSLEATAYNIDDIEDDTEEGDL